MKRVAILGTGLIGASIGLALKDAGFAGEIAGWDANAQELEAARERGAIDRALASGDAALIAAAGDVIVLATPVLPILDWMRKLAPLLSSDQLVTDAGSTKREIAISACEFFNKPERARFLPGHPMAGKESGGAGLAEASLFRGATWLFTPVDADEGELERDWRAWVARFGANVRDVEPDRHDAICAWVSHLPQMLSTALAALLEEELASTPEGLAEMQAIGGRALRETTRLGSSPYSMWRDIALTNTEQIARTLHALEQRLAHVRENLRTHGLREEFAVANRFRAKRD